MHLRFATLLTTVLISTPLFAKPLDYRVLTQGLDIGHFTVDKNGKRISVDFDYKQNGRGPTIKEQVTLDADGAPIKWSINGRTTFGNAVQENFSRDQHGVKWSDLAGPGSIKGNEAPKYYVSQNGSPLDTALLAKALLKAPDHSITVAPTGVAKLTERDRQVFDGPAGKLSVVTYELSGLSINPSYITLDSEGEFFATASARFVIARAGYERAADKPLRDLAERLASERFASLQKTGAHRYTGPVRIRNVRVFDPAAGALSVPSDVTFIGNRISGVQAAGSIASPNETTIEGGGGTLIPGLFEMHGHVSQEQALLNVLAGVTSMRDMGNQNDVLDVLIERISKGEVAGPRIIRSGFIEGKSPFSAANGILVDSQDKALDAVRWYAARGYAQVKLYNSMNPAWAPAIAKEAHQLGMRVAGHVPAFSNADAMIAAGFDEITHVNQLLLGWVLKPGEDTRTLFRFTAMRRFDRIDLNATAVKSTLDTMVAKGTAHEPTIAIHELGLTGLDGKPSPGSLDYIEHMPPAEQRELKQALFGTDSPKERAEYVAAYAKILEVLSAMHKRGILLIPGTDLGGAFNFHRELELFAKLGMTPAEVLRRATLDMARYTGQDQQLGSIERGKLADFFLIPGDPTQDLKAIKTIRMVVNDGTVYFPSEIYPTLGIRPFTDSPTVQAAAPPSAQTQSTSVHDHAHW